MKTVVRFPLLCAAALFALAACKKNDGLSPQAKAQTDLQMAAEQNGWHLPLTVKTIAGKNQDPSFADGPGKDARFFMTGELDLMDDGTLYVVDELNNKIRKITPDGIVSTANIPANNEGHNLLAPRVVRVQKDGTINILTDVVYDNTWIVKPNGEVITPDFKRIPTDTRLQQCKYRDLERDPYSNDLILGGLFKGDGVSGKYGILERFEIKNNQMGVNIFNAPTGDYNNGIDGQEITCFIYGYNRVKYIVIDYKKIFKLTPSGEFTRLYKDFEFSRITDIKVTKDSRTLYIADFGKIRALTQGKVVYLAGPQKPYDSGDGVGSSADVDAYYLALSKDEGTLYFTNNNCVRKMLLR